MIIMKTKFFTILFFLFFCEFASGQIPGTPYLLSNRPNSTSNGYAIVTNYTCSTASAGNMTVNNAVSGVTQTITATVTKVGNYNISTNTANGVSFSASGTFPGTGSQDIVLTASGTPISFGSNTFTLNTTPNCNFSRTTLHPSSNGSAIVSSYTCSTASAGIMKVDNAVTGVTQTITANVTTAGTYNISTNTENGVSFSASGTFQGTGSQNIELTATGIPSTKSNNTFTLNTAPNCNFIRYISSTGCYAKIDASNNYKDFLCHNLGADTGLDPNIPVRGINGAYGQWGRKGPTNWQSTTNTQAFSAAPTQANNGNNNWIGNWTDGYAPNGAWTGGKTVNDPCPSGFRVPTKDEWVAVNNNNLKGTIGTFTDSSYNDGYGNNTNYGVAYYFGPNASTKTLTLPANGWRSPNVNSSFLHYRGIRGYYWSCNHNGAETAFSLYFEGDSIFVPDNGNVKRIAGMAVRCISQN